MNIMNDVLLFYPWIRWCIKLKLSQVGCLSWFKQSEPKPRVTISLTSPVFSAGIYPLPVFIFRGSQLKPNQKRFVWPWKWIVEIKLCSFVLPGYRLTGAVVRAGLNNNISQNTVCGSPVTSAQASIPGEQVKFVCNPPVAARYVSVDNRFESGTDYGDQVLTLCEVMVEEYPMDECQRPTSM